MKSAREKIVPSELGIQIVKVPEAASGGLVIEIPGKDGPDKADTLADSLRVKLGESVRVSRPKRELKLASFRVRGLDPSVTCEELRTVVSSLGGCPLANVAATEIRRLPGGLRVAWVKCPINVADTIAFEGHLNIGWSFVAVDSFKIQRIQCFKCWRFGHVRETCAAPVDRANLCFRCGSVGHAAKDCVNDVKSIICAEDGEDAAHRMGSAWCMKSSDSRKLTCK